MPSKTAKPVAKNTYEKLKKKIFSYFNERPEQYLIFSVNSDSYDILVFKKIYKNIKIKNTNNIFMIFEKCEPETFIVPIFIQIGTGKKYKGYEPLKGFECKFINIKNENEIEWKLEEFN